MNALVDPTGGLPEPPSFSEMRDAFVAEALKSHAQMLEGLVLNGCCICGDLVTTIIQKPTWDLELVPGAEHFAETGPSIRVTGEYRVLCVVHAEAEAPVAAPGEPQ